jgi:hypothetical protein
VPSLADSFIFLTLTRLVVVFIFVNFSFALFTPPSRRLSLSKVPLVRENLLQIQEEGSIGIPRLKKLYKQFDTRTSLYSTATPPRLPLPEQGNLSLTFLITWPRVSHSTLVVAQFTQVKLHVPINTMILS